MDDWLMSCEDYLAEKSLRSSKTATAFTLLFHLNCSENKMSVQNVISRTVLLNKNIFSLFYSYCKCSHYSPTLWTQLDVRYLGYTGGSNSYGNGLSVPVYFMLQTGEIKWNVIHPLKEFAIMVSRVSWYAQNHITKTITFWVTLLHYDAIVATDTGWVSLHKPVLIENSSQLIDLCDWLLLYCS